MQSYVLEQLLAPPVGAGHRPSFSASVFERLEWRLDDGTSILLDRFPGMEGVACCFLRLPVDTGRTVRFSVEGAYQLETCEAGGWLLKPLDSGQPHYWLPKAPVNRRLDSHSHILAESSDCISAFQISPAELAVEVNLRADMCMDWVIWRLPASDKALIASLERLVSLELQPYFFWGSKKMVKAPADVYLHLVHGQVYANDFVYPRRWKFWSEHDAHGLYVTLSGLEIATGKPLYGLLKKQLLFSVIARQAPDGGWRHGEWTDLMESHYRSHNGAMLTIESALEELECEQAREPLAKAIGYTVSHADQTDIGLWFLHDSLEESAEAMDEMLRQTGTRWIPSRALGKSPSNKLILNTHLDAIVALDRYQQLTGDQRYAAQLASARQATHTLLSLRPAETVYRLVYGAVWLTLLPKSEAQKLSLAKRIVKRLTWMYLIPNLHRLKRYLPRMVMPGGLVERHLSALHFGTHYHAVNLMDLARYARRFPGKDIDDVIHGAVEAGKKLFDTWSESPNQRFAIVVWADALYHLCTISDSAEYRRLLAEAMLRIADLGLGLPPSLLGGDAEAVPAAQRVPCPSPADIRVRVANLSRSGRREFVAVNPTMEDLDLAWQDTSGSDIHWAAPEKAWAAGDVARVRLPARGWLIGLGK
jgi:hypothetical protein